MARFLLHGRYSTYTNHRCRCDLCREAYVKYQREWRARRRLVVQGKVSKHGTQWGYKMGCRCVACRAAVNWYKHKAPVEYPK